MSKSEPTLDGFPLPLCPDCREAVCALLDQDESEWTGQDQDQDGSLNRDND